MPCNGVRTASGRRLASFYRYACKSFFSYKCSGRDLVAVLGQRCSVIRLLVAVCGQYDLDLVDRKCTASNRNQIITNYSSFLCRYCYSINFGDHVRLSSCISNSRLSCHLNRKGVSIAFSKAAYSKLRLSKRITVIGLRGVLCSDSYCLRRNLQPTINDLQVSRRIKGVSGCRDGKEICCQIHRVTRIGVDVLTFSLCGLSSCKSHGNTGRCRGRPVVGTYLILYSVAFNYLGLPIIGQGIRFTCYPYLKIGLPYGYQSMVR